MNNKNYNLISKISFVCFSSLLLIFSLVLYALSFEVYNDGFGIDFSTNEDLLVGLLVSIIIFIYSLIKLISKKEEIYIINSKNISITISSFIISFYSFGKFFKYLAKKGSNFIYVDYQVYLYLGFICLALAIYTIFKYLNDNKK